jgi:hypothetical protein
MAGTHQRASISKVHLSALDRLIWLNLKIGGIMLAGVWAVPRISPM